MEELFKLLGLKFDSYKDYIKLALAFVIIGFVFNLFKDILGLL